MIIAKYLVLFGIGFSAAVAQDATDSAANQTIKLTVSTADKTAAVTAKNAAKQFQRARNGKNLPTRFNHARHNASGAGGDTGLAYLPKPGYFITDVSYNGGAVIDHAVSHPVYVNTDAAAVGNPVTLLRDLGKSDMAHVVDEYVGLSSDDRYKAGSAGSLTYPTTTGVPLQDADVYALVHAAAAAFGKSGYHVIYHIFLAPGQDVCSEGSCYSPDNLNEFGFCAYHDSVDFNDVGHVIYTLIPFQAVPECQTGPPSPNGLLIDSQMSTLSHELFESITDPDGDAWWNTQSYDEWGSEIADICVFYPTITVYPVVRLNGKPYELQADYSNKYHGCAYAP